MSELTIYAALRTAGMTAAGACGLMGNMARESVMHSNNLQDSYNAAFGLTDEQYTALVDAGKTTYNGKSFANDQAGYGLCQWTHPDRKGKLLSFAKSECASIGNEAMQVRFAIHELKTDFAAVWKVLCSTNDVYEAADIVCRKYEMPAVNNVDARASSAQAYLAKFAGIDYSLIEFETEAPVKAPDTELEAFAALLTTETMMHLQVVLFALGYKIGTQAVANGVDGYNGKKCAAATKDLADKLYALL